MNTAAMSKSPWEVLLTMNARLNVLTEVVGGAECGNDFRAMAFQWEFLETEEPPS